MAMSLLKLRRQFVRRAIEMQIGGFRRSNDRCASWFGRVNMALPGQRWPTAGKKPMHALCQINLTELPWRPPRLDDVEFIAVFVAPDLLPRNGTNGSNWCLRAYPRVASLVPLPAPPTGSTIKAWPMRPRVIKQDCPCYDDIADSLPEEVLDDFAYDEFDELFRTAAGFKLGGWPSLIQSEISWRNRRIAPEFVFQVPTTKKGNWMWGDNGTGYFGRGTAAGRKAEWTLEWQCY